MTCQVKRTRLSFTGSLLRSTIKFMKGMVASIKHRKNDQFGCNVSEMWCQLSPLQLRKGSASKRLLTTSDANVFRKYPRMNFHFLLVFRPRLQWFVRNIVVEVYFDSPFYWHPKKHRLHRGLGRRYLVGHRRIELVYIRHRDNLLGVP